MSDSTGFAMMTDEDYQHNIRQLQRAVSAEDRHRRREAAIDRLDGVDTVRYAGEKWLLLEITPDGRAVLEQYDAMATVEPTAVEPVR